MKKWPGVIWAMSYGLPQGGSMMFLEDMYWYLGFVFGLVF